MAGELRHFIGGTLVEEPGGWRDFKEDIERDLQDRIIYPKYPISLQFVGDGYALLRDAFETSYCTSFDYRCEINCDGGWQTAATGVIYLTDIRWNLSKCIADTPITDNTVGATILNNKEVPVYPTSELSKNAVEITPVTPIDLEVFDPTDPVGDYLADTRMAFDWLECMNHAVQFITDGAVTVVSDWYDALPSDERYCMVTGLNLRTHGISDLAPQFNLKDLYAGMWKAHNLMAALEVDGSGNAVIRIEEEDYFFGTSSGIAFMSTEDLTQEIDTNRMYAKFQAGSKNAIKNEAVDPLFSLPYLILRTFSNEEYPIAGQCNTNVALDLRNPWVICTNAIQDAVVNNDDRNDEEVFMIQYDYLTAKATKGDYLSNNGGPYLYNETLQNQLVVSRWNVQAQGVNYVGSLSPGFLAEHTTGGFQSGPLTAFGAIGAVTSYSGPTLVFDDDSTPPNNDPDGNWDTGTQRYTAPTQGFYQFDMTFNWFVIAFTTQTLAFPPIVTSPLVRVRIAFYHYDSGGTLLQTSNQYTAYTLNPPPTEVLSGGFLMSAGDYIEVEMFYEVTKTGAFPYDVTVTTFLGNGYRLGTQFVAQGGGQFETVDPDDYYVTLLKFNRAIDNSTWNSLKAEPKQSVGVGSGESDQRNGYIRLASRTIYSGATEWELLTNRRGRI